MINNYILKEILKKVENGEISADNALRELQVIDIKGSEFFIDNLRRLRQGFDEVIYGRHKTKEQIEKIAKEYIKNDINFLCTALNKEKIEYLREKISDCEFLENAMMIRRITKNVEKLKGTVSIVTAGTSDVHVAYEAKETLFTLGVEAKLFADIGVAGMHRIFEYKSELEVADVIIAIAGMEGALPSVIGGIFSVPIIAVPTSVGYGAALNGFTALFSMLTSCASGITVVNIDNGFGAAMAAFRILKHKGRPLHNNYKT